MPGKVRSRAASAVGIFVSPLLFASAARAEFNLEFSYSNPGDFTPNQLSILNTALDQSERMRETALTGYQPGILNPTMQITIHASSTGLASGGFSGTSAQGGYVVTTTGLINVNVNEIENFANWQGVGANGLNFMDELLAHEVGHVLGVGTQWENNGVYVNGTYQYTGASGVAAYQAEFDPAAAFVPVENAGSGGTIDYHWDQRMRSSPQEGNPSDPWSLDPRVGVTDALGRDRGLELMSGAIDPDWREPFLSRTTIESMYDLGFTFASPYDFNHDGVADAADLAILTTNLGAANLQIDSIAFGDVDRDRDVDATDLSQWNASVPEPACLSLIAMTGIGLAVRRNRRASSCRPGVFELAQFRA